MYSTMKNKIEARDTTIKGLLKDQKFFIDYFQREYQWTEKHITKLIEDLTNAFLKSYDENHELKAVENYQNYYIGPVVFNKDLESAKKSIIDGQQRITSITLLLIYLHHSQQKYQDKTREVNIKEYIFSDQYGEKSFNMSDEYRKNCLKGLFDNGYYKPQDGDNETAVNMSERYNDIETSFPKEDINEKALPYFIYWLIEKVVFVEIIAYSEENAYTIFETMNDRGLSLTSTEMLKAYVLSKINEQKKRDEIDDIWKTKIQELHKYDKNADQSFFQALFRGKYAKTFRPGKVGSENQDFEKISTCFHIWFKDEHKSLFNLSTSDDFYLFFKDKFPFYVKWYLKILDAQKKYNEQMPHLNYIYHWGIAESLREPMLLAPVNHEDSDEIIQEKIDFVARYIETFTVKRGINFRSFSQSSIKLTMFNIIKKIRNNDSDVLSKNLAESVSEIPESWEGVLNFGLHGQNRRFVKHLLSRISSYIDSLGGVNTTYVTYQNPGGKSFEIEHIWANKFEEHKEEFEQENAFKLRRNSIGDLILLPNGINQSFSSDKYEEKLKHYIKQNSYAQTLHPDFYEHNPNFLKSDKFQKLQFQKHLQFKEEDILKRAELVKRICEQLWSTEYFT